jgi:hypothetical protein
MENQGRTREKVETEKKKAGLCGARLPGRLSWLFPAFSPLSPDSHFKGNS